MFIFQCFCNKIELLFNETMCSHQIGDFLFYKGHGAPSSGSQSCLNQCDAAHLADAQAHQCVAAHRLRTTGLKHSLLNFGYLSITWLLAIVNLQYEYQLSTRIFISYLKIYRYTSWKNKHYITLHYLHFKRHLHLKWPVVHQQLHVIRNTAHRPSTQASYTASQVRPKGKSAVQRHKLQQHSQYHEDHL